MPRYKIEMITTLSVIAENKTIAMKAARLSEGDEVITSGYGIENTHVKPMMRLRFRFITNKKTESEAAQYLQTVGKGLIVDAKV